MKTGSEDSYVPLIRLLGPVVLVLWVILALMANIGAMGISTALFLSVLITLAAIWIGVRTDILILRTKRDALVRAREATVPRGNAPLRAKIVEGVTHPLMLIDPKRKILEANKAARDIFGKDMVGKDVALVLRDPDALTALRKTITLGTGESREIRMDSPVPRVMHVDFSLVVNHLADTSVIDTKSHEDPAYYVVVSIIDITDIKAAERMRADFVANASHELRTPLSSLLGFIETLQGPARGDQEASDRFLAIMHEEAERMTRLIDDLLSLSRIELQKHQRPVDTVDINGIINSVTKILGDYAQKNNVTLDLNVEESLPKVSGDRDQLIQVMQNLVSNAIKYGRQGGHVTISANTEKPSKAGHSTRLQIKVMDDGEGIAPEHLPRLTERFYRIDNARSRKMGGTGLGLAIVKHIVDRHGGRLNITSELGKGTSVIITLPTLDEKEVKISSDSASVTNLDRAAE